MSPLTGFPEQAEEMNEHLKDVAVDIAFELSFGHVGQGMAIKSHVLETQFGLRGTELREIIRYLRRDQHPICSMSDGYFWASTEEELEKTRDHLRQRIHSMQRTLNEMTLCRVGGAFNRPKKAGEHGRTESSKDPRPDQGRH